MLEWEELMTREFEEIGKKNDGWELVLPPKGPKEEGRDKREYFNILRGVWNLRGKWKSHQTQSPILCRWLFRGSDRRGDYIPNSKT